MRSAQKLREALKRNGAREDMTKLVESLFDPDASEWRSSKEFKSEETERKFENAHQAKNRVSSVTFVYFEFSFLTLLLKILKQFNGHGC